MRRDRKGEPHVHSALSSAFTGVSRNFPISEKSTIRRTFAQSPSFAYLNGAIQEDILAAAQLG